MMMSMMMMMMINFIYVSGCLADKLTGDNKNKHRNKMLKIINTVVQLRSIKCMIRSLYIRIQALKIN